MCDRDCNRCFNSTCIVDERHFFMFNKKNKKNLSTKTKNYSFDYETKKYLEENYERTSKNYEY